MVQVVRILNPSTPLAKQPLPGAMGAPRAFMPLRTHTHTHIFHFEETVFTSLGQEDLTTSLLDLCDATLEIVKLDSSELRHPGFVCYSPTYFCDLGSVSM